MRENSNKKKNRFPILLLLMAAVVGIAVLASACSPEAPVSDPIRPTVPTEQTEPAETVPDEPETFSPIDLGSGLIITDVGSYTGSYMEDGSDELVSGVMMIVVYNDGDDDIQLADIELLWNGESCSFRLTNLVSGARVVLLEQDRRTAAAGYPESAQLRSMVLFEEPMELYEDAIEIGGLEGMLNVRNISGEDIDGDICIYYKYAAQDIYYGGITFRVRIEGGLKAGELRQIPAGHFDPDGCAVVQVTIYA